MAIEFTIEDIINKTNEWRNLERKGENHSADLGHDFFGPAHYRMDLSLLTDLSDRPCNENRAQLLLSNKSQFAIAKSSQLIGNQYVKVIETLLNLAYRNLKKNKSEEIKDTSRSLHRILTDLDHIAPIRDIIKDLAPVNEEQDYWISRADFGMSWLLYTCNKFFSPEYTPEQFILDIDYKSFVDRTHKFLNEQGLVLTVGDINKIHTSVDYMSNVIEPIIWNAAQHATIPGEKTYLTVLGKVKYNKDDFDVTPDSPYILKIWDRGKGMEEKTRKKIFQKGFTTKKDDGKPHGIGLYQVKKFVEDQGGSIKVGSTPGKGTMFEIEIPYNRVESKWVCIQ